jgi:hypothetical protein
LPENARKLRNVPTPHEPVTTAISVDAKLAIP